MTRAPTKFCAVLNFKSPTFKFAAYGFGCCTEVLRLLATNQISPTATATNTTPKPMAAHGVVRSCGWLGGVVIGPSDISKAFYTARNAWRRTAACTFPSVLE